MSAALAQRSAPVRRRRPGSSTPAIKPDTRNKSHLQVVKPVSKTTLSTASMIIIGVATVLTFVVVFQTIIAEQQLRLDKISTDVRLARQHYDELRQQRAELRAPDYLRTQAMLLGMSQGFASKFAAVPADVVAIVLASTGAMDQSIAEPRPLESLVPTATGSNP